MPLGTYHEETGTLRWTKLGYALETDGGGVWQLELSWTCRASAKVNRRVTVEGIRNGFDMLAIKSLRLADPQPTREDWESDPTLYRRRAEQKVLAAILRARGRGW